MTEYLWPTVTLVLAVLAYRFGGAVLATKQDVERSRNLTSADRDRIDTLAATVRELDVQVKQIRNTKALSGQRVTGV